MGLFELPPPPACFHDKLLPCGSWLQVVKGKEFILVWHEPHQARNDSSLEESPKSPMAGHWKSRPIFFDGHGSYFWCVDKDVLRQRGAGSGSRTWLPPFSGIPAFQKLDSHIVNSLGGFSGSINSLEGRYDCASCLLIAAEIWL